MGLHVVSGERELRDDGGLVTRNGVFARVAER